MSQVAMDTMPSKKNKSEPITVSPLDDLPDELLTEILLKLPQHSVHRCKTASKRWFSLISSPHFATDYVLHRPNCPSSQCSLIFQRCNHAIETASNAPPFNSLNFCQNISKQNLRLLGSCNGLILYRSVEVIPSLYVCNPITMQAAEIPPPPNDKFCVIPFKCGSSNSLISNTAYDKTGILATRYKVIAICTGERRQFYKIKIFSLDSGDWREQDFAYPPGFKSMTINFPQAFAACNGKLCWCANNGVFAYDPFSNPNECNFINFPEKIKGPRIGVCAGHIRICEPNSFERRFKMWELEDFGTRKWNLKYQICLSDFSVKGPHTIGRHQILYFHCFGAADDEDIAYISLDRCLFLCNIKTKTLELTTKQDVSINALPFVVPWWPVPLPDHLNAKILHQ